MTWSAMSTSRSAHVKTEATRGMGVFGCGRPEDLPLGVHDGWREDVFTGLGGGSSEAR